MKLSAADVTPTRVKFNSHLNHNPSYDIVELVINRDAFITYYVNLEDGSEGMEYYRGENYVVESYAKSTSRNYPANSIPKRYLNVWRALREYYLKNFCPVS